MSRRHAVAISVFVSLVLAMMALVPLAMAQQESQTAPVVSKGESQARRLAMEPRTTKVFHLSYMSQTTDMQDLVNTLRTIVEIQRISMIPSARTIVVSTSAEQMALTESLINQLDKPKPASAGYKLEFRIAEIENGKAVESKFYTLLVQPHQAAKLSARAEAPRPASTGDSAGATDLGSSIECTIRAESERAVVMTMELDLARLATGDASGAPPVRQIRSQNSFEVELGKPTLVSSLDDASGKRTYQVEVTVTRIAAKS